MPTASGSRTSSTARVARLRPEEEASAMHRDPDYAVVGPEPTIIRARLPVAGQAPGLNGLKPTHRTVVCVPRTRRRKGLAWAIVAVVGLVLLVLLILSVSHTHHVDRW